MFRVPTSLPVTALLLLFALVACRTESAPLAQALTEPTVHTQTYSFTADPSNALTLTVAAQSNINFTADVLNQTDHLIAALNGSQFRTANLTIPPGNGAYTVRVASSSPTLRDSIRISLSRVQHPPDNPPDLGILDNPAPLSDIGIEVAALTNAAMATAIIPTPTPLCTVHNPTTNINIRSGPNTGYGIVGHLPAGTVQTITGRSENGWFAANANGVQGWISGSVVQASGDCAALPIVEAAFPRAQTVTDTAFNTVSSVNAYSFVADRDIGGEFEGTISYPGSRADMLTIGVSNLVSSPPNHQRTFAISLLCEGIGVENVRWGTPEDPSLICGNVLGVPFSVAQNQQSFIVVLPQNVAQSTVNYRLRAVPAAPVDQNPHEITVGRDTGGQFSDVVSMPDGDHTDILQVGVTNLNSTAPDQYRLVNLTLICGGTGTQNLRWGLPDNPTLACDSTLMLPFTLGYDHASLAITLLETQYSYVSYTLLAEPAAPDDAPLFYFDLDRNGQHQFTDAISNVGDTTDTIQMRVTNLTAADNYREFTVTLFCDGSGVDRVRWGMQGSPSLACGSSVVVPFVPSNPAYNFAVTLLPDSPASYIRYSLLASAVL